MKTLICSIGTSLLLVISGCAMYSPNPQKGQPIAWNKQGVSDEQAKKDKYECDKEAKFLSQGAGMSIMQSYYHALAACYDNRGYTVTKRQE